MNLKNISSACLLIVLGAGNLPAMAQTEAPSEQYSYGTRLDIAQVISLTEDSSQTCGVVNAQLTYLDSIGERRALT